MDTKEEWEGFALPEGLESERIAVRNVLNSRGVRNQELYGAFLDAQKALASGGVPNAPTFIVCGYQRHGKTSFCEAIVGFRFSVVLPSDKTEEIGTKCILNIQCVHNKMKKIPHILIGRAGEDFADMNEMSQEEGKKLFESTTKTIEKKMNELIEKERDGGRENPLISSEVLTIRIEAATCANITLYDCFGFRAAATDHEDQVKAIENLIRNNPKAKIVWVQNGAGNDWTNCEVFVDDFLRKVDEGYRRCFLVVTKVDRKLDDMKRAGVAGREAVRNFLTGSKTMKNHVPLQGHFVSLPPMENAAGPMRLLNHLALAQMKDVALLGTTFQQEKGDFPTHCIGLFRCIHELESIMHHDLEDAALSVRWTLAEKYNEALADMAVLERHVRELGGDDGYSCRMNGIVDEIICAISTISSGSTKYHEIYGRTFGEIIEGVSKRDEKAGLCLHKYNVPEIPNSLDPHVGAQSFLRLVRWLERSLYACELGIITNADVAAHWGAATSGNLETKSSYVNSILREKSHELFGELLGAYARAAEIAARDVIHAAVDTVKNSSREEVPVGDVGLDALYVEVKSVCDEIVSALVQRLKKELSNFVLVTQKYMNWSWTVLPPVIINATNAILDETLDSRMSAFDHTFQKEIHEDLQKLIQEGADNELGAQNVRIAVHNMFRVLTFRLSNSVRSIHSQFLVDPLKNVVVPNSLGSSPRKKMWTADQLNTFFGGALELAQNQLVVLRKHSAGLAAAKGKMDDALRFDQGDDGSPQAAAAHD